MRRARRYTIVRVQFKGEVMEINVLVGFGKHDLCDLLDKVGTPQEREVLDGMFNKQWPPRYRRISICTPEEIEDYRVFGQWLIEVQKCLGKRSRT